MADKHIPDAAIRRVWLDPRLSTTAAARKVGLARSNLWRRAVALGLPPRKQGRAYTIHDHALLRQLWEGRVRASDIAALFKVGDGAVFRTVRRLELSKRPHGMKVLTVAEFMLLRRMEHDAKIWEERVAQLWAA
ncbi:MAG: hypothetical protein HC844_04435 [Tabrizicola sp.]|nr:hypothetical protein [Tabrizicola sp.]NKB16753.1 hypothetical protein [Sphingomonadales bacterium]